MSQACAAEEAETETTETKPTNEVKVDTTAPPPGARASSRSPVQLSIEVDAAGTLPPLLARAMSLTELNPSTSLITDDTICYARLPSEDVLVLASGPSTMR